MGPVRQNPIQRTVSLFICVCIALCTMHTILHRTDLIVFSRTLQTITTAPMMSIRGKGGKQSRLMPAMYQCPSSWQISSRSVKQCVTKVLQNKTHQVKCDWQTNKKSVNDVSPNTMRRQQLSATKNMRNVKNQDKCCYIVNCVTE